MSVSTSFESWVSPLGLPCVCAFKQKSRSPLEPVSFPCQAKKTVVIGSGLHELVVLDLQDTRIRCASNT